MLSVESTSDSNNYLFIHNKQTLIFSVSFRSIAKGTEISHITAAPTCTVFPITNIPPTRVRYLLKIYEPTMACHYHPKSQFTLRALLVLPTPWSISLFFSMPIKCQMSS